MEIKEISLYVMAAFYFIAGVNHFRLPKFYNKIVPPFLPNKELINYGAGALEIVLAILLIIPQTSHMAALGVILLLIAVYPANIYHLVSKGAGMNIPQWALWVRLPLQFVFIFWAYWHTH